MLNLRAGEKAFSLATFLISATYLKAGIDILCEGHWEKHYDLSSNLYSLYAEAEYCNGHFQEVGHATGIVIKRAKSFENKLRVYATLIKSLAAQNLLQDAMTIGFGVLTRLGVSCTSSPPEESVIMNDIMEMKMILIKTTDVELLNFQEMKDDNTITAMKFLQILTFYTYLAKQQYLQLFTLQMMQLTLHRGVCNESCYGMSMFSFLLCQYGDFKAADRIGHLSILLLNKCKAEEYRSNIYSCYYGI
eukprot:9066681-Ditylum_brightwellii.AAC.1